jgi:hypothetical protein
MKVSNAVSIMAVAISMTLASLAAQAQDTGYSVGSYKTVNNADKINQVGVGLQAGSLSGVNAEYWVSENRAFEGSLTGEHGNMALSAAHLWMNRGAFSSVSSSRYVDDFVPFIGAGALVAFGNQSDFFDKNDETVALAAQIPLGIEYMPRMQRFSIFADIAPSYEVTPIAVGFVTADLGARLFF